MGRLIRPPEINKVFTSFFLTIVHTDKLLSRPLDTSRNLSLVIIILVTEVLLLLKVVTDLPLA